MAPRAIWKGSITFGLITIPVKIHSAVGRDSEEKLDFHLLHAKDGGRIHYQRTCDKGHKNIDWDEIVKGYEYSKGKWVEITDKELEALDLDSTRSIDVVTFAPLEQIDPLYFDKSYYVIPDGGAVKAYRLMFDALKDEGLVGVCKVALREREHLSALRTKDRMLILQTMYWPEEIREPKFDELGKRTRVNDRESKMAKQLIRQLTDDFDPGQFKDECHKALKKLIRKKVKGEEIVVPQAAEERADVIDLMDALKASVEAAKRGEKPERPKSTKKKPSSADLADLSKKQLEERARKLKIEGRSRMTKEQLVQAISSAA